MSLLGWYFAVAALVFAWLLDDAEPETAALGAVAWPLFAALFVAILVAALASMVADAWTRGRP